MISWHLPIRGETQSRRYPGLIEFSDLILFAFCLCNLQLLVELARKQAERGSLPYTSAGVQIPRETHESSRLSHSTHIQTTSQHRVGSSSWYDPNRTIDQSDGRTTALTAQKGAQSASLATALRYQQKEDGTIMFEDHPLLDPRNPFRTEPVDDSYWTVVDEH